MPSISTPSASRRRLGFVPPVTASGLESVGAPARRDRRSSRCDRCRQVLPRHAVTAWRHRWQAQRRRSRPGDRPQSQPGGAAAERAGAVGGAWRACSTRGSAIGSKPICSTVSGKVLSLPVTDIVQQFVGLGANMDIDALNRALGQPGYADGAYLLVDDSQTDDALCRGQGDAGHRLDHAVARGAGAVARPGRGESRPQSRHLRHAGRHHRLRRRLQHRAHPAFRAGARAGEPQGARLHQDRGVGGAADRNRPAHAPVAAARLVRRLRRRRRHADGHFERIVYLSARDHARPPTPRDRSSRWSRRWSPRPSSSVASPGST